jgi:regulator of replication initiation timing
MALANKNPARAMEINLTAMRERLGRAEARAEHVEEAESALEQFETMAEFGEGISRIAQEVGKDEENVEELLIEATSVQLEVLVELWERVAEQVRPAIEGAMAKALIRHEKRVRALEQRGIEAPELPVIPPMIRERVEERMRGQRI